MLRLSDQTNRFVASLSWATNGSTSEASGGRGAIDAGYLIAFAELLAGRNHPVRETEHRPCKEPRAVDAGFERECFQMDVIDFVQNILPVIFRHKFIVPVIHFLLLGETDGSEEAKSSDFEFSTTYLRICVVDSFMSGPIKRL